MIVYNTKAFTARILVIAIGLCWLAIVPLTAGCSPFSTIKKTTLTIKKTTKRITNVFDFSNENLKKKVGLALFENKTLISGLNFEETFPDNLATAINEACPDVLLVKPGEAERKASLKISPKAAGSVGTPFCNKPTGRSRLTRVRIFGGSPAAACTSIISSKSSRKATPKHFFFLRDDFGTTNQSIPPKCRE